MRRLIPLVLLLAACSGQRAERLYQDGKSRLAAGNRREALRLIGEAVRVAPNDPKYRLGLGIALARSGANEQARTELEAALRLDPASVDARRALKVVTDNISADQAAGIAAELR